MVTVTMTRMQDVLLVVRWSLTLDASREWQRSRNDEPSVVISNRSTPHRVDTSTRRSCSGRGDAAGRIDVEDSEGIVGWKKASVVGQDLLPQLVDAEGWVDLHRR
jgi:hypothetical protein